MALNDREKTTKLHIGLNIDNIIIRAPRLFALLAHAVLGRAQLCYAPGMGDFLPADWAYLRCGQGVDGNCVTVEGHKFDLERGPALVDVNDRAHIAGSQMPLRKILCQNNPIMFLHHGLPPKSDAP